MFTELYNKVFNSDGTVKSCGRKYTMELIILANSIKPNVDFGSTRTGFMNTENLKALYEELNVGKE